MARYKVLKGVAHNIGHSFTSLMNYRGDDYVMGHILRRAREVNEPTLMIDLLTGEATPKSLLTPEIRDSISRDTSYFPKRLTSQGTDLQYVRSARMSIAFDLSLERPVSQARHLIESPYVCRVEIEDDRGKVWTAEFRDWWYPETDTPANGLKRLYSRIKRNILRRRLIILDWAIRRSAAMNERRSDPNESSTQ
jgi:thymidylate synthase